METRQALPEPIPWKKPHMELTGTYITSAVNAIRPSISGRRCSQLAAVKSVNSPLMRSKSNRPFR